MSTAPPPLGVRPYRPGDLLALYDICLRTGDGGQDAAPLYRDPMLLGHLYAAPYATLCPETCFVLGASQAGRVVGYVLGVPDTAGFAARCEAEWFPLLRGLYPLPGGSEERQDASPDARQIRAIHQGLWVAAHPWLAPYPAHLHINLLPEAQGKGHGRRLMTRLLDALRARDVPGVHLGVSAHNVTAQAFYERLGFQLLEHAESGLNYGLRLN